MYKCLADIGCDHAYVSIEAVKRKLVKKAIACDISPGPLEAAKKNIGESGMNIELRLGDGLEPIGENEADVVVVAGMGGMRILGILSEGFHKIHNSLLIMQPQHDLEKLRRGLFGLGFGVAFEKLVKEDGRFYEIIVAKKTASPTPPTEAEFFLGSHSCELAREFYLQKMDKINKYILRITEPDALKKAERELWELKNRINKP